MVLHLTHYWDNTLEAAFMWCGDESQLGSKHHKYQEVDSTGEEVLRAYLLSSLDIG